MSKSNNTAPGERKMTLAEWNELARSRSYARPSDRPLSELGQMLERYCQANNLSFHALAKLLDCADSTMHQWLYGDAFPSSRWAPVLEDLLGPLPDNPNPGVLTPEERAEALETWSLKVTKLVAMHGSVKAVSQMLEVSTSSVHNWKSGRLIPNDNAQAHINEALAAFHE